MEIQNYKGNDWRCTKERFERQVERAKTFEAMGATDIKVWYDDKEYYVKTSFSLDGDNYQIQVYKIWNVRKNGIGYFENERRFNNEFALFTFFEQKKHLKW